MITGSNGRVFDGLKADREAMSTEGIENGARFNEIDTDTRYRFDGENQQWYVEEDGPTDEQVADAVGDWLDENVDPETGYVLDRTLQQPNAAAPADLVGDLKSASDNATALVGYSGVTAADVYRVKTSSTTESVEGTRLRIVFYISGEFTFSAKSTYSPGIAAQLYSTLSQAIYAGSNYIKSFTSNFTTDLISGGHTSGGYLTISMKKPDGGIISDADKETMLASITMNIKEGLSLETAEIGKTVDNIASKLTLAETQGLNKFNGFLDNLTTGRVYDGVFSSSITTIKCTDYIPVEPNKKYFEYGGFLADSHYLSCYTKDKTYISTIQLSKIVTTYPYTDDRNYAEFTIPASARYIRVNFFAATTISSYNFYLYKAEDLDEWAKHSNLIIGDSISTDYYGNYKKWVTNLIDSAFFTKFYTENDSIHATGFVATYQTDDDFVTRLKAKTASDYESVIVFGGVNDFIQSVPMTDFTDAVDEFFDYLTENYSHARICTLLPLMSETAKTANSVGKVLHDYTDYIKTVCKNYCIPVLNLTDESGFMPFVEEFKNEWTIIPTGYETHDGVHPTEEWEKRFLTPMIRHFLSGLM